MLSRPHIILLVTDIARTVAFYEALGFREVFRVPAQGDPVHVDVELDGYRIGLATDRTARDDHHLEPVTAGHRAVVVLWTDDLAADLERVTALGARQLQQPKRFLGLTVAFVEDPAGHAIQLVQAADALPNRPTNGEVGP